MISTLWLSVNMIKNHMYNSLILGKHPTYFLAYKNKKTLLIIRGILCQAYDENTIDNFFKYSFYECKLIEGLSKIRCKPSPNAGGDIRRKAEGL
ncbi:hypothetical protein FORC78_p073 (plasmid) [Salmonella enterica]|nr:hypothetical protein FORC78_p073 [Salmonella enterica]